MVLVAAMCGGGSGGSRGGAGWSGSGLVDGCGGGDWPLLTVGKRRGVVMDTLVTDAGSTNTTIIQGEGGWRKKFYLGTGGGII